MESDKPFPKDPQCPEQKAEEIPTSLNKLLADPGLSIGAVTSH